MSNKKDDEKTQTNPTPPVDSSPQSQQTQPSGDISQHRRSHKKIVAVDTKRTSFMDNDGNWTGENVFDQVSLIGSGGFGEVWKVRHIYMHFTAAAKIIKSARSSMEQIQTEIATFKTMKHTNILSYLGTYRDKESVWIVM
ncbi:serine/threonine protein kinase, putative, partial [Entamoeba invadens IP1]